MTTSVLYILFDIVFYDGWVVFVWKSEKIAWIYTCNGPLHSLSCIKALLSYVRGSAQLVCNEQNLHNSFFGNVSNLIVKVR